MDYKTELKAAGLDTIEKIENKLLDKMRDSVNYVVSKENTAILEIMLVDGNGTPLDKEHFPEDGLDICISYDNIFGGKDVDYKDYEYTVIHMFSETIDAEREAGDIEVLKTIPTEEGLKVHVKGLSPFAISYEEKDSTDPNQPIDPDNPADPEDSTDKTPVDKDPVDEETTAEDSAETGDDSNMSIYLMVMLAAGVSAAFALRRKRI